MDEKQRNELFSDYKSKMDINAVRLVSKIVNLKEYREEFLNEYMYLDQLQDLQELWSEVQKLDIIDQVQGVHEKVSI